MRKISLIMLALLSSCVSVTNSSSESKQSRYTKKILHLLNFKQSMLNRVIEDKQFVRTKDEQPTPSKKEYKNFNIENLTVEGRNVFIVSPKSNLSDLTILYLHGGAYMANTLPIHWNFITKLIKNTGATIIIPDYPLAPDYTWENAFSMLQILNNNILKNYDNLLFMGDSAGAGLALSWTMELNRLGLQLPKQVVLFSPWLDVSMENSNINATDELDPYLSKEALIIAGKYWAGSSNTDNWQISPINGDLTGLPPITIFTGTSDILNPDARLFYSKMTKLGLSLDYNEYEHMIHDWMFFNMPESKTCLNQIIDLLTN